MVLDETGIIVDLNAACSVLIGADRLRLIGQQLAESFRLEAGSTFPFVSRDFVAFFENAQRYFRFSEVVSSDERANCRCFRLEAVTASASPGSGLELSKSESGVFSEQLDIPIPSFCVLASGRIVETNSEYRRWVRSAGSVQARGRIFKYLQEIVADGERQRMDELLMRAVQGGQKTVGDNTPLDVFHDVQDEFATVFGTWISVRLRCVKVLESAVSLPLSQRRDLVLSGVCIDVSRHRQIEESLYSTEERFALAVSASLDGIWEWRVGSHEVYFSGRLAALLGYERAAFRALIRRPKGVLSLIKKQDRLRFVRVLRSHLRSRAILDLEFRAYHRDRGIRWYRIRGQALWSNTSGSATRVAGSLTDVTENRELRSHLQSQLDSIDGHAVLLTFDAHQMLTQANERFLAVSGFEMDDIRSKSFRQLIARGVTQVASHSSRSPRLHSRSSDYAFRTKNSNELVVRGALSPLLDIDGQLQGYSFFGFDVSEKYLAERELASEIAFRKAVFDSAGSIIITTDPQGIISTVNTTGLARLECAESEVVGQKTPSIFFSSVSESSDASNNAAHEPEAHRWESPNRRGGFLIGLLGSLISGQILTKEGKFRSRSGNEFPVLMSLSRVENAHREFIGYVIVAQDISELKRIEKLKNDFVSTVSHELRTPLTSISGALKVVNAMPDHVSQSQATELIKMALRNSDRLLFLINDLLDMQKIESGRMDFEFKEISLQELVQFSVSTMEAIARERSVSLQVLEPEIPVFLVGDFNRLVQVMVNLLSNAIKFAPEKSTVFVSLRQARGAVRVGVRDSGPGVPQEFQSRIFEKFSQADGSDSKIKGGTGLGLSICKAIVAQHHGNIQFWSDPLKGTEFYFEIPERPERSKAQPKDVSPDGRDVSLRSRRATVLVVEDDPDIADFLSGMLEEFGCQTIQARTVAAARTILAQEFVDLVTLDLIMPDANGAVLLDEMARSTKLENVPVLVISGYTDRVGGGRFSPNARHLQPGKRMKAISEGHSRTNHFATLSKPVKASDLQRLVTQALGFRSKRVMVFVAKSNGTRAVSFLRGVCEHSASVIELSTVQDAIAFLSQHVAACVILADVSFEDQEKLLAVLRQESEHTEQACLIRWHLEDDQKLSPISRENEVAVAGQAVQQQAGVGNLVRVIEIFGMHWGAAAQFQQLLSESGVLEAS